MSLLDLFRAATSLDEQEIAEELVALHTGKPRARPTPASSASSTPADGDTIPAPPPDMGCGFNDPAIGRCIAHVDGACTLERK